MAQVPLYPVGGRVAPEARGPVYQSDRGASLDAFGSTGEGMRAASQKLGQFSDEIGNTALRIIQEDNDREAKRLDIDLSRRLREINYGDGTEENPGYLSLRGEAAIKSSADVRKAVEAARNDVLNSTKNLKVRQMVDQLSAQRVEGELGTVDRHLGEQRRAFDQTLSEARIQEAASDAAANWNDPTVMARSMRVTNGEILSMAQKNGWSDEIAKAKLAEARSIVIGSAVKQAIAADNVEAAQKILDTNEAGLPAAARIELYTLLRNQSVEKQGQALGDTLWQKFGNDVNGALKHLQEVATGKVRDAAWSQWQKIVDASQSKVERDRAKTRFEQEQQDRNNPVTGKAVSEYWALWNRGISVSEATRTAETREEDSAAKASRDAWTKRILGGEQIDPAELAKDEQLNKHPEWRSELLRLSEAQADRADPTLGIAARRAQAEYERKKQENEATRLAAEREQTRVATEARDEWTSQAMTNNGLVDLRALANDPRLASKPEWRAELQRFAAQVAKEDAPAAVSRQEMVGLFERINLPEGDPRKVVDIQPLVQSVAAGKLGKSDYEFLKKALTDSLSPEGSRLGVELKQFLDGYKGQITRSTSLLGPDPNGDRNFYLYSLMVHDKVNEFKKAGKDPRELFNPTSKEFLGAPGILLQYQPTMQQRMQTTLEQMNRTGGGGALPSATTAPTDYKTLDELLKAYREKKISKAEAEATAKQKGWAQ